MICFTLQESKEAEVKRRLHNTIKKCSLHVPWEVIIITRENGYQISKKYLNVLFDHYTIKTTRKETDQIVGHLPMEISRITKFLIDRSAVMTAKLTSDHYRWSPLIQGGLDIPCLVTAKMNGYSAQNQMLLKKYEEMVNTLYVEPKNEVLGSFLVPAMIPQDRRDNTPLQLRPRSNYGKKTGTSLGW